MRGRKNYDMR